MAFTRSRSRCVRIRGVATNEVFILILLIAFPVVGYLIGNSKGRPVLGTLLGFFLGVIGWIIIAVVPTKR